MACIEIMGRVACGTSSSKPPVKRESCIDPDYRTPEYNAFSGAVHLVKQLPPSSSNSSGIRSRPSWGF